MKRHYFKTTAIYRRAGLGLIEVLVGLTVTLIVLVAMMQAFKFASTEMQKGRASLELTNRIRAVENLLRKDLSQLTVELKPYHRLSESPKGYVEIADGPRTDINFHPDDTTTAMVDERLTNLLVGDYDDVFAGTIKSDGRPFRGRGPLGNIEESPFAEVVWFTTFNDTQSSFLAVNGPDFFVDQPIIPDQMRLFRRQLIIKPALGILSPLTGAGAPVGITLAAANLLLQNTDVSARVEVIPGNTTAARFLVRANSLEDLAFRHNRFAHVLPEGLAVLPHNSVLSNALLRSDPQYTGAVTHRRAGNQEDLMLTGVMSFDVKVFDPAVLAVVKTNTSTVPPTLLEYADLSDIGWRVANPRTNIINPVDFEQAFGPNLSSENGTVENGQAISVAAVSRIGAYVDLGKEPDAFIAVNSFSDAMGVTGALTGRNARPGVPDAPLHYADFNNTFDDMTPGNDVFNGNVIYDTGTSAYDRSGANPFGANGIDDDGNGIIDDGDGLDVDGDNDQILEPMTGEFDERLVPPYPFPIRGLSFTIRAVEPITGQVSQTTLKQSFISQ